MYSFDETFNTIFDNEGGDEKMKAYTADFETTTDMNDCRIWAYAVCDIDNPENVIYGNSMLGFFDTMRKLAPCKMYFHNLGFDGAFIFDYLLNNNWQYVNERSLEPNQFNSIISDMNELYQIGLRFSAHKKVVIYDSLKIIPLSIKEMAVAYKLHILKGDLDYTAFREVGHELTEDEKYYIKHDVQIAAMVLKQFFDKGLTKMTAGSNALADYKFGKGGEKMFRVIFPEITPEEDEFMRKAYRGGFTYVNPQFQNKDIGEGIVLDVNSLYPSVMRACDNQALPWGEPIPFEGTPYPTEETPLWIASISTAFHVKPGHIPCLQLKNNFMFKSTEYITDSKGNVDIIVTNVDWELMQQQYDIAYADFHCGYYFKSSTALMKDYVDKWTEVKINAGKEGNAGLRQIAKLMLNSLYGKFATRTTVYSRKPELDENGAVTYVDEEPETRSGVYLPAGVFITAYARYKTITSAQSVYDRFIYADTDSLHLIGTEEPDNLKIDEYELGAWKHESTFNRAKFLRAKCYIEQDPETESLTIHVAGMPKSCHKHVTFDNFKIGATYDGKLYQRHVKGGIVLYEGPMQIREI